MSYISLARVRPGALSAADAAAIVLAVARDIADRRRRGDGAPFPGVSQVRLHRDGRVTTEFTQSSATDDLEDNAAPLARMVATLLGLPGGATPPGGVPGPLMVAVARALRTIDLPPLGLADFISVLARYGSDDPRLLRRVFARLAQEVAPDHVSRVPATPVALRWAAQTLAGTAAGFLLALIVVQQGWLPLAPVAQPSARPDAAAERGAPVVDAPAAPRASAPARVRQPYSLGAGVDAFSPSFSPEGRELLFHIGRRATPLVRASLTDDGRVSGMQRVLDDGFANYHASMSPDGRWIAYDSDRGGTHAVYVMPAQGGAPAKVSGARRASVPTWSPDGRLLAYVEADARDSKASQIWIADLAAGTRRQVTAHAIGTPWSASWFPDGRRIAYSREDTLVIADLEDPSRSVAYRSPRPGRLVRTPAVSPDGRQVVFQVFRDGGWMLDVERRQFTRVLDDPLAEEFVWRGDGRAVAYHTRREDGWSLWSLPIG